MPVKVKICGLSEPRGLEAAIDGGASYVGFVFFRRSPRYVTVERAAALATLVPRNVVPVGLFVDPTDADLEKTLNNVRLGMIQLHGKETPERVDAIRLAYGLPVMKAIGVSSPREVMAASAYEQHADWLLFDAKAPKTATRPGGNALAFDWSAMKAYTGKTPWMLAGGLTRANAAAAVAASGARVLDVSSGVESRPGGKSPAKIRAFLAAVKTLSARKAK